MIFQVAASILMIMTLKIYYGGANGDPDQLTIIRTLENKNIAIALLYISRLLSGWSAGKCYIKNLNLKLSFLQKECVVLYQQFI